MDASVALVQVYGQDVKEIFLRLWEVEVISSERARTGDNPHLMQVVEAVAVVQDSFSFPNFKDREM